VRMARENSGWGYDRIVGAMANLGYTLSDQTVGNILQRHGIPTAPKRERTTTWADFIRAHMSVLAGTDFFSVEVLTLRGLVTYYVLFFIHLDSRKVEIAGMTPHPNETWRACPASSGMTQIARNVTMDDGAFSVIAGISSMIVIPSIVDHFGISSNLAISKHCDSPRAARI
jgi:putative transposase